MTIGRSGWALAFAAIFAAGACGSADDQFVKDSDAGSYLRVPSQWEIFGEDAFWDSASLNLTEFQKERQRPRTNVWVFDRAEKPSVEHAFQALLEQPVGVLRIVNSNPDEIDTLSPRLLRNQFHEIDAGVTQGGWPLHTIESLDGDGFRGERVVVDIPAASAVEGEAATNDGSYLTWDQTVYMKDDASKAYFLTFSCEAHCYEQYRDEIDDIVDSWKVQQG